MTVKHTNTAGLRAFAKGECGRFRVSPRFLKIRDNLASRWGGFEAPRRLYGGDRERGGGSVASGGAQPGGAHGQSEQRDPVACAVGASAGEPAAAPGASAEHDAARADTELARHLGRGAIREG